MDWDFSKVNVEYLIQARDLARSNPRAGAMLLGMSDDLVQLLSEISPRELALITQFKPPLIAPRHESWGWQRLFNALQAGNSDELRVILDHAGLLVDAGSDMNSELSSLSTPAVRELPEAWNTKWWADLFSPAGWNVTRPAIRTESQ